MLIAEQKKRLEESTKVKGISFDSKLDRFIAKVILCARLKYDCFIGHLQSAQKTEKKLPNIYKCSQICYQISKLTFKCQNSYIKLLLNIKINTTNYVLKLLI